MEDFIVERFADGEEVDTINVSRKGALNQALISRLTEISVSDEWDVAKHEWRATGNVWYRPLRYEGTQIQELPSPHQENHPNYCVCGHPIAWHFEVENTENGTKEILGSEHITNWMIIRHLIEDKGIPESAITEEKIIKWMKEAVKTMKQLSEVYGTFVGPSSGANWLAAQEARSRYPEIKNVLTFFCDEGEKYLYQHFQV